MSASPELTSAATLRPVETVRSEEGGGDHGDEEECRTPTSEESKLPSLPLNCPPAPRKRRRVAVCRRRRPRWQPQVELIVVGAKEMEQLFQRREEPPPRRAKRQRRHTPDDDM
ncbi:unnamed protein product [Musa acuminata subsp. malaccensis]|uniref:(wild Malaysian banana) hypothetical protein n=1 Tax=Musa acuminata subsp. malaccensis TaxID=214687 RepID=A0A804HSK5_MUSAM|nr:unnamed protein product [Musa acuminata subsp. malaccensis]